MRNSAQIGPAGHLERQANTNDGESDVGGSDVHNDSDASEREGMATLLGAGDQENSSQDGWRPRLDAHGFVPFSCSKLQAAECHRKYLLDCLGESHCRVLSRVPGL
jgi:hypothetical protein